MEEREIIILIGAGGLYAIMLIYVIMSSMKERKRIKAFNKQQKKAYNKCVDLIISEETAEAKKVYNNELVNNDSKKPFLHGIFIGQNLKEHKKN